MGTVTPLGLTALQVIDLVRALDGYELSRRTLANWVVADITPATIRPRGAIGRGNGLIFGLADLARIRLIVRLRGEGLGMQAVRVMLAFLDRDEQLRDELLRPKTRATLVVDKRRLTATMMRPGQHAVDLPSGQLRFALRDVVEGNLESAKRLIA